MVHIEQQSANCCTDPSSTQYIIIQFEWIGGKLCMSDDINVDYMFNMTLKNERMPENCRVGIFKNMSENCSN